MSKHYMQADYMKESRFWMNVKPLIFNKTDYRMFWKSTDDKGREYKIHKNGRSGAAYLRVEIGGKSLTDFFDEDSDLRALAHGSDHYNNGFNNLKSAAYFASCLAATSNNQNLAAGIYLAPHFIDWKAKERGVYVGRFDNPHVCGSCGDIHLSKEPSGWAIKNFYFSRDLRRNQDRLPEPNAIMDLRFNTKKQAGIAAGLFLRDVVNTHSFFTRHPHLERFVGRDLMVVSKDAFNKFNEILNAVSHTGWCRDTFEATVYAEASKATKGYPQPDDCLSAALMLLRAYGESK